MVTPTPNTTILQPAFASKAVHVQREVDSFPFSSLVADCGGVLGMFIGFNFLMIWDWMEFMSKIITNK